ncbi:hypothetical protein D3C73_1441700 [compost metagenome]
MICGEMNLPSISCTIVQTAIILSNITGDVTSATINAGVMAIAGPRYGTTLVNEAIIARINA